MAEYVGDVVRRLTGDPHVALALFELRLEATRRPVVAATLSAWRRRAFEEDVRFHSAQACRAAAPEIALLHHAIDGLMLDRLTIPLDTGCPRRSRLRTGWNAFFRQRRVTSSTDTERGPATFN